MKIRYIDGATQKHVYEEHTDHLPFVGDLIMFPGECCYKVLTINAQNGGADVECRHLVTVVDEHTRNSLYYQILIDRCTCHRGSPSHNPSLNLTTRLLIETKSVGTDLGNDIRRALDELLVKKI